MINSENRSCLLVVHPYREEAKSAAITFTKDLQRNGFLVYTNIDIAGALNFTNGTKVEIALVLGGDGTILRAAELVKDNRNSNFGRQFRSCWVSCRD
jgi:NAD+ kinase